MLVLFLAHFLLLQAFVFPLSDVGAEDLRALRVSADSCRLQEARSIPRGLLPLSALDLPLTRVNSLSLYRIADGEIHRSELTQDQLRTRQTITVEGHVCGLVILCQENTSVRVEGQEARKIMRNEDGTLSIERFGRLPPEDIGLSPSAWNPSPETSQGTARRELPPRGVAFVPGAYSFFPGMTGALLTPKGEIRIDLETEGRKSVIRVRQAGYRTLRAICLDTDCRDGGISFRYAGSRLAHSDTQPWDFDKRLRVITDGIANVEKAFGARFISHVNILDYRGEKSAVTCDEGKDIWLYEETFLTEPLSGIKAMAERETLHKVVHRMRWTADSEMREHFANISGYGRFSNERFHIMRSGSVPSLPHRDPAQANPFLLFIDERNFLEGTKGGRSHQSMEEYCASFLHSLMFIERLPTNLDRLVRLSPDTTLSRYLSMREKMDVLNDYVRSIEVMIEALPDSDESSLQASVPAAQTESFLKNCLIRAREIRSTWVLAGEEPMEVRTR